MIAYDYMQFRNTRLSRYVKRKTDILSSWILRWKLFFYAFQKLLERFQQRLSLYKIAWIVQTDTKLVRLGYYSGKFCSGKNSIFVGIFPKRSETRKKLFSARNLRKYNFIRLLSLEQFANSLKIRYICVNKQPMSTSHINSFKKDRVKNFFVVS